MRLGDRTSVRSRERSLSETVAYTFLLSGIVALIVSIFYTSHIVAFVGLGLTFWGALLLYLRPKRYIRASLFDSVVLSLLRTVNETITELNYLGKAVYLPPRYLDDSKSGKVFIPSKNNLIILPTEKATEEKVFFENPKGMCITPPGLDLTNLYENRLRKSFTEIDIEHLQSKLPKLFIEDLEIAENLEIDVEGNKIEVKISGVVCKDIYNEIRKHSGIYDSIGCPICSSIAIALTRVTGKLVIIEQTKISEDAEIIKANFRLLEALTFFR